MSVSKPVFWLESFFLIVSRMQQAVAAEFAAKRVFQCPLDVKWLTKQPTNYAESREKARQKTYSSKQVRDFEAYQNHVLRRCEGLSV
jgi:hypothetical protein